MSKCKIDIVYDFKKKANEQQGTLGTVWIRTTLSRSDRRYVSTGVRVLPSQWNENMKMVVERDDAQSLNMMILEQLEKCRNVIRNSGENATSKTMKVDRKHNSFLEFMDKNIDESGISDDTKDHHRATLRFLADFGKMNNFAGVTNKNIKLFVKFIGQRKVNKLDKDGELVVTKIKQCTVKDHYKRLRKYVRLAIAEGYVASNVLEGIIVENGDEGEREFLYDDEIEKWVSTKMKLPCLEMARLRFTVQMGCGLSYKDFINADYKKIMNIDGQYVLTGARGKTHGKGERKGRYFSVLLPFAVKVLKKWDWKIPPICNVDYNRYLERVAANLGIEKHVTSHVARHTYACYCLRHGIRIEAVQKTLGHSRLSTTQRYARLMDMDIVNEFEKLRK